MDAETRTCQSCSTPFVITSGDFALYEKTGLEIPVNCFSCRVAQHFAFWPFGKFRSGVSALSGQSLITMLPANCRYPIYSAKEWWSDAWDAMDYAEDYDESRSFFEQLKELQEKVPRPHQQGSNSVGSEWSDDVYDSKNIYLSRSVARSENISYGYRVFDSKDSFDLR